jgi:hypothetical protein
VAILLSEGISRVRVKTRHDVDTRVTDALITDGLNDGAKKLRGWLAVDAPTLYLVRSDTIDVSADDPEISLVDSDYNFENIHRVERLWEDVGWRRVMRADEERPNESIHGRVSFRLEHLCLILGPDNREDITGQYRIVFHPTPARLSTPGDNSQYLQVPSSLDLALVYLGCVPVMQRDKEKEDWIKLAKAEYDDAIGALANRYGVHQNEAGLRRTMGY